MGVGSASDSRNRGVWTSAFPIEPSSKPSARYLLGEPENDHSTGVIGERCVKRIIGADANGSKSTWTKRTSTVRSFLNRDDNGSARIRETKDMLAELVVCSVFPAWGDLSTKVTL